MSQVGSPLDSMTNRHLRYLCRVMRITIPDKLPSTKKEADDILRKLCSLHFRARRRAATKILLWYREKKRRREREGCALVLLNDSCVFSLEPFAPGERLLVVPTATPRHVFRFRPTPLLQYFLSTGETRNPYTQEEFPLSVVARAKRAHFGMDPTLRGPLFYTAGGELTELRKEDDVLRILSAVRADERERQHREDVLRVLRNDCNELIAPVLDFLRHLTQDTVLLIPALQATVTYDVAPRFFQAFSSLVVFNRDEAETLLRDLENQARAVLMQVLEMDNNSTAHTILYWMFATCYAFFLRPEEAN